MKVGQLKELIKDMDDNLEVIKRSNNYELKGSFVPAEKYDIRIDTGYRLVSEQFWDDFDNEPYHTEVYVHDKDNGETVLII